MSINRKSVTAWKIQFMMLALDTHLLTHHHFPSHPVTTRHTTPTPHPLCIFKNHYPMMKSTIQIGKLLKVQISSSMAKIYFFHLSSEMFYHRHGNVNLTILTPIPSHFLTFLDNHHVIMVHSTTRTTDNAQRTNLFISLAQAKQK